MEYTEKPLQPLQNGIVLIVGVKSSNLNDEIRNHPRVVVWDSQHEHWTNKDLPANTQAVFMTRWLSHNAFDNIVAEARKRRITVFNPEGTGMIARQVKELLSIPQTEVKTGPSITYLESEQETTVPKTETKEPSPHNKLHVLFPFIDFSKGNTENARILIHKAKELGITTTGQSLAQFVSVRRRKMNKTGVPRSIQPKLDVSVEILDGVIKELKDVRDFLIATVDENRKLKAKVDKFRKFFDE